MKYVIIMTVEMPEDMPVEDMIEGYLASQGIFITEPDDEEM